ncbi:MAG TPA: TIGR03016 family PEP-CTERM system-associated outer membrane protein [Rhizomicrobium sp.]|nr:TIGR03016 family PEP-CTERM system-associated outer membrane protein [Rhizomicrobium sp.]
MGQNRREMLAKRRRTLHHHSAAAAILAVSLLAASSSFAQQSSGGTSAPTGAAAPSLGSSGSVSLAPADRPAAQTGVSSFADTLIPGFRLGLSVNLNETYATNASGVANSNSGEWLTDGGLSATLNEHSRRVSLDATYQGNVSYYSGAQPTQWTNSLETVGNVIVIPDYLNFIGRAFAQPVVISNVGITTANNSVAPGGFRNSYGFSAGPDITFHLGDFASSETNATYSAAYYTNVAGGSNFPGIPGVAGPENTTSRSVSEQLTSGPDFSRLAWSATGLWSEMDRYQGLFSEKTGVGTLQYAITREFALLGTGGYDDISNVTPLSRNVSGPIAMGGFSLTFDDEFSLEVQVGEKYHSPSYLGSLRWNIGATTIVTGTATDSISTPEGQMLSNLSNLTASLGGQLTSSAGIYSNGAASSLGGFSAQSSGSLSFNQQIARYQRVSLNLAKDLEREHFNIDIYGERATQLSGTFVGRPVTNSWGGQAYFAHNFTPLFTGTVGLGYTNYQELGGSANTIDVTGELTYSLSQDTNVYTRVDYLRRDSSAALQALSPFTGSLDDARITIGINHTILP